MDRKQILLLEDHQDSRDLLIAVLEDYSVTAVETLDMALEALQRCHFDLILSDLTVPGSQGPDDLLQRLKDTSHGAPIALISGSHTVAESAKRWGTAYLMKPVNMGSLISLVESLIR